MKVITRTTFIISFFSSVILISSTLPGRFTGFISEGFFAFVSLTKVLSGCSTDLIACFKVNELSLASGHFSSFKACRLVFFGPVLFILFIWWIILFLFLFFFQILLTLWTKLGILRIHILNNDRPHIMSRCLLELISCCIQFFLSRLHPIVALEQWPFWRIHPL